MEIGCSSTESMLGCRLFTESGCNCHMNMRDFLSGWCFPKVSLFLAGNTQLTSIFLLMRASENQRSTHPGDISLGSLVERQVM